MKKTVLSLSVLLSLTAVAGAADMDNTLLGNENVISPEEVVKAQSAENRLIDYMLKTYSDKKLIAYAKMLNKSDIDKAKILGATPPALLTDEDLSDRNKIGEYLRSRNKYTY
jgi:hypothetical protein